MAKRQDLKRKLKSADRRRRRRAAQVGTPAGAPGISPPAQHASDSVDVSGLIVNTILRFHQEAGGKTHDAAVVAAVRGCLNASAPRGEQSARLHQHLEELSQQGDVETRSFRRALSDLMEMAKRHEDTQDPRAFLRYLALLVS